MTPKPASARAFYLTRYSGKILKTSTQKMTWESTETLFTEVYLPYFTKKYITNNLFQETYPRVPFLARNFSTTRSQLFHFFRMPKFYFLESYVETCELV